MNTHTKELRGWELSSTCAAIDVAGAAFGRQIALAESGAIALAQVISMQARKKFGTDDPAGEAKLDAFAKASAVDGLKQLGESLLDASDWTEWLTGIEPHPALDPFPEFARDEEFDPEPEHPCFEMTAESESSTGDKTILRFRFQKWYQPDLGALLFKDACRLEARFNAPVTMVVFLLWPSADGPGITGGYQGTDRTGRKVDFQYKLWRAWELPPEQGLAGLGTMLLVPLSKGAKDRMRELIQLTRERLEELQPSASTLDKVWGSFYFGMGMSCSLEESHSLLGDLLPMIQSLPSYKRAYANAFNEGYAAAIADGPLLAIRDLLIRQAGRRFGDDPACRAALESITSLEVLKTIARRVLTAAGWSDLLAGRRRSK
jgi:hypothetical protein